MAIRSLLRQIQARGELAIVVDPECEYVSEFYRPVRGDLILNPVDERCPYWSPWLELSERYYQADAATLAASLIPEPPRGYESGSDHFFRQSSRTLLESLLQVAAPREPQSIPKLLELNRDQLKQALSGTPAYSLIDPGAHEQGAGIIATVANATRPFLYLPPADGRPPWSALEWSEHPEGWLFVTMRDESNSAALPLANLWLDLIVGRLLNSARHRRRVWIVVDELPVLGRQAKLETLVTRGRKRGLAAVLGFQSIAQLRRIYGHEQAAVLASMPSTKLLLRVDEPETAAFIARQIGEREALREEIGMSTAEHGNRFNIHPTRRTEPVVMASEIQRLPKLEGYLCIAGLDRARVKVKPCLPHRRQVEFIPRALPRPVIDERRRRFGGADDESRADSAERDRGRPSEDSGLMLVMSKGALTAAKAETYYEEKYSHDDYYSEKQRVVGQWFGRGAEELGLSGEIATEDFRAVLRGLRPASGEVLVHKANGYDDRRAGWDATFNAPKSVSIQGLVGDDHRLIEAHEKAVSRALVELEQYALSRRRGGSEWVVTGNVVAARFDHIAARPASGVEDGYGPDPHLHTHVVIANMTRRPDGEWRGLDPIEIYRAQSLRHRSLPLRTGPRGSTARIRNQGRGPRRTLGAGRLHARAGDGVLPSSPGHRTDACARRAGGCRGGAEHRASNEALQGSSRRRKSQGGMALTRATIWDRSRASALGLARARAAPTSTSGKSRGSRPPQYRAKTPSARRSLIAVPLKQRRCSTRWAASNSSRYERKASDSSESGRLIAAGEAVNSPRGAYTTPEMIALERGNIELMRAGQGRAAAIGTFERDPPMGERAQLLPDQTAVAETHARVHRLDHLNRRPRRRRENHNCRRDPRIRGRTGIRCLRVRANNACGQVAFGSRCFCQYSCQPPRKAISTRCLKRSLDHRRVEPAPHAPG